MYKIRKKFDVVVLSCLVRFIPDLYNFLNDLKNITEYVIIGHHDVNNNIPSDSCQIEKSYNAMHRDPVDLRNQNYLQNYNGIQYNTDSWSKSKSDGNVLCWLYGIDYLKTLIEYLDYDILHINEYKDGYLFEGVDNQRNSQNRTYYDLVFKNNNSNMS